MVYGRDPRQPIEEALSVPTSPYVVDLEDYKSELVHGLSDAWNIAHQSIELAQKHQKAVYDRHAKEIEYQKGDRVMVYMPHEVTGKGWKWLGPTSGPTEF